MAPSFRLSSAPESADEATAHNKEIYDQLRRVAETFPSAPSLIGLPCSRHPDGWYTFTNGVVSSMVIKEHLTARATDIFLTTFPKSSTTWLKALLYSTLHRGTDELVAHSPHQLVPFLESQVFANDRIPDLSSLPSPRLFMTHIPSQSLPDSVAASGCNVVYLCRDPKDCFVSLWHFWNRFMPWDIDEAHRQFCDGARSLGRSGSISSATGGGTSRSRTRKNNFFCKDYTHFMASSSTAEAADGTSHMEIYDQLRQVVETFPAAVSGIGQPYCRHPDGWYMSRRGVVSAMAIKRHLMARTTDVFIATFPKSGTTWLKALIFVSWNIDVAVRQFCNGISHFGPFWEHVLGYWRWHVETPSQVFFLTYEELAADTLGLLRRLAEFVGHPFTVEEQEAGVDRKIVEICAMESSSRLDVNLSGALTLSRKTYRTTYSSGVE
uniref:Sulfotransferase n=1 Tax=Oryza sativa subsp. japonica TaxID=39947 RepID=Q2RAR2_ORYSJ|nr:Sulfotransferase domain containing protein [Oryza sativa Japonica Group]